MHDRLHYDSETGVITWKTANSRSMKRGGMRAGYLHKSKGYRAMEIDGKYYFEHRVAWFLHYGEWPASELDHINCVKDDNRISNLRLANRSTNLGNTKRYRNNTSGFKGVYRRRSDKWIAYISVCGIRMHLGTFDTPEAAYRAYCDAAVLHYGEFANLG